MSRRYFYIITAAVLLVILPSCVPERGEEATLSLVAYRDKVHGWWLGKIIGATLGMPYEFKMPWPPKQISFYTQHPLPAFFDDNDDLYVPLVFLLALEEYGTGLTQDQVADEFSSRLNRTRLWLANKRAYLNLKAGITPPETGHPVFNEYALAIDAQIQNDIWGVVCPGMPNTACEYADAASHISSYADGAYGGIYFAAVTSLAFFENDIPSLLEAALAKIPAGCDYAEAIRDVFAWHRERPDDWKYTREKIEGEWVRERGYAGDSAVVNGAAVAMALLYSEGDFDAAVTIGCMGGWDTDCNAATAGGVIGIIHGASAIPEKWNIFHDRYHNISMKDIPEWMSISELSRRTVLEGKEMIIAQGGREKGSHYVINVQKPLAPKVVEFPEPRGKREQEEWAKMRREKLAVDCRLWNPGVALENCAADGETGLIPSFEGMDSIFVTRPLSPEKPAVFRCHVPAGVRFLEVNVAAGKAAWRLKVVVNGKTVDDVAVEEHAPAGRGGTVVPERDRDIVLYVGSDGTTYFDEALTDVAGAAESYLPGWTGKPLTVGVPEFMVNLFPYGGEVPEESYEIILEGTDDDAPLLVLLPGKLYPRGFLWNAEPHPEPPLPAPRPVKIRLSSVTELPSIPRGARTLIAYDGGKSAVLRLPRVSMSPGRWYSLRYELPVERGNGALVELLQFPVEDAKAPAYWGRIRLSE